MAGAARWRVKADSLRWQEGRLCVADVASDIHCVPSYNFIEADLRSIVRPVDSRRGVVCVRARMCAWCVLAPQS